MKFYEILLLIILFLMCVFGKPARKPRRSELSTDKLTTTEATTISVMLTTTSVTTAVNESRIDSSIDCLDCAKVIKLKEVTNTEKPTIIGDAMCAFCQQYLDPVEKDICIMKHCASG